ITRQPDLHETAGLVVRLHAPMQAALRSVHGVMSWHVELGVTAREEVIARRKHHAQRRWATGDEGIEHGLKLTRTVMRPGNRAITDVYDDGQLSRAVLQGNQIGTVENIGYRISNHRSERGSGRILRNPFGKLHADQIGRGVRDMPGIKPAGDV